MILVLLLYVLFGSAFTIGKMALDYVNPMFFIAIRMTGGGLLLLGYQYWVDRKRWRLDRQDWWSFTQIALFHICISYVCEFWSLQYVSGSKASLIYNTAPFVTALYAYLIYSEKLTLRQWIALGIGCIGLIPVLETQDIAEKLTFHVGFFSMPELMLMVSVFASSYAWIVMKPLVTTRNYSSVMVNGVTMFFGGLVTFLISFIAETRPMIRTALVPLNHAPSLSPWIYAFLMMSMYCTALIILINLICYNLYSALLKQYSPTFLSFAGFTTPIFTAFFDWVFLGSIVPIPFLVSMAIIVLALFLFYQDELLTSA